MTGQVTIENVFDSVDEIDMRLHSAMRAAEMITAITHVCTDSDNDKEDLVSILRGLTSVCERLTKDVAEADEALSKAWKVIRPVVIAATTGGAK